MTLKHNLFIKNPDIFLAYFMLSLSLIYFGIQFILSKVSILPLIFFFISLLYINLSRKSTYSNNLNISMSSKTKILNEILFIISFSFLVKIYLKHSYPFPIYLYYILMISAMSILVSVYSLNEKYYWNPFFKIIILFTFIRASIYYQFPDIYGIDPLYHYRFCEQIINTHSIPKEGEFLYYSFYPIYHILLVQLRSISLISLRDSVFLMGTIQSFIISLFIFLTSKKFSNIRILGLLAIFIFCSCANVIHSGIALIPNTFSLILFIVSLYLMLCIKSTTESKTLLVICLFSLTFTHPYPPLFFALIAVILIFSRIIYKFKYISSKGNLVDANVGIVVTCLVLFISNLSIWATNPLLNYVVSLFFVHVDNNAISPAVEISIPYIKLVFNDLSHNITLGIALFGVFSWFNPKNSTEKKFSLAFLSISLLLFLFLINVLNLTFIPLPDRIWPFAYIPISIIAAQGLTILYESIFEKNGKYSMISVIVTTLLVFFFSITSPQISPDISFNANNIGYRTALTSSEIASWKYAINSNQSISTDFYYKAYTAYKGYNNAGDVYNQTTSPEKNGLILSREYTLKNYYLRSLLKTTSQRNNFITPSDYWNGAEKSSWYTIYDNGDSWVYKLKNSE